MTRNGLLTLIAIFTALALFVRLENTALTQIFYPLPPYYEDLGSWVEIRNIGNDTIIMDNEYGLALGESTVGLPWTVFDVGLSYLGYGINSRIDALNAGAVISTAGYDSITGLASPAILNMGDVLYSAGLRINSRTHSAAPRFFGDDRTLIEALDIAIANYSAALDIFDSRIQAGGVGISHEFGRTFTMTLNSNTDPEYVIDVSSTAATMAGLRLTNTQIGEPGRDVLIGITYDPDTWELIYEYEYRGINVDYRGMPEQVTSYLFPRQHSDKIANDRILVGQDVILKRNPIGEMLHSTNPVTGKGYEYQSFRNDLLSMNGPNIGIRAIAEPTNFIFSYFDDDDGEVVIIDEVWTGDGNNDQQENVRGFDNLYTSSYRNYSSYIISPSVSNIPIWSASDDSYFTLNNPNHIQLTDNSWIFAGTGISLGGGTPSAGQGVRVTIDSTSGIYSSGSSYLFYDYDYDYSSYYGYGTIGDTIFTLDPTGAYYGGYGITDRYSLTGLMVIDPEDVIYFLPGAGGGILGYSGSFHEMRIEGKVIVGEPSLTGIRFSIDPYYINDMTPEDKRKLNRIYYYDPNDPDAGPNGRVYYTEATAGKFVAYNNQPNRIFWVQPDGLDPIQLTYYDNVAQRWTVHPDAAKLRLWSNPYPNPNNNASINDYFTPFDSSSGVGIDVVGTSMAYEGEVLLQNMDPWSVYFGPTVREITVRGDDALVSGGNVQNGGAAMFFGSLAHVSKVIVGDNHDVKNLSDVLFVTHNSTGMGSITPDVAQSAKNFQAFDKMTSAKRSKFLYDPLLAYTDSTLTSAEERERFHFDNAGVHGDIVSWYNAVAYIFGGSGTRPNGDTWELTHTGVVNPFWYHPHGDNNVIIYYYDEILGIDNDGISGDGPSYILGHRNGNLADVSSIVWTADNIPGTSIVLDEVLLWYLAGRQNMNSNNYESHIQPSFANSYGYASGSDGPRHFREALARYLHFGEVQTFYGSGALTASDLLAGYTQDGTLLIFSSGDIFSGNIYGGGIGDWYLGGQNIYTDRGGDGTGENIYINLNPGGNNLGYGSGNIDLRVTDGTTMFNRNVIEYIDPSVDGSIIRREPGIRVRDLYVEKTGHLLMNDSQFTVNPFMPLGPSLDYAERLIIHDVLNEGIVSGNGVFRIAQRRDLEVDVDYFAGYFINRGVLALGLPGFVGETEKDAREIEKAYHEAFLKKVSLASGDVYWEDLMRGVPGGQYGVITVFGSLQLTDEHARLNYDITSPLYNTMEILPAGKYDVTIGNDTIGTVFGKYVSAIDHATSILRKENRLDGTTEYVYDESLLPPGEVSKEDWQIIATEKLGTHLSWFSPSAFVDKSTRLPLLNEYEQFEYLTNPARRTELQRKLLETVLSEQELRLYDANPAERARLTQKIFNENNIRFELTQLDTLLMRYGFSDVVSVHGTVPAYVYGRYGWENVQYDLGSVPPYTVSSAHMGVTHLGGVIQADRIYDLDADARSKDKQTSFIIIASEGFVSGSSVKMVTSATNDWVYAHVDVLPYTLASGQQAAVLTVVDDPNYYRNRVSQTGKSYNARSVGSALDDAMLTNPGLAQSFQFSLNSPEVLNNVFRQVAAGTRANSLMMNVWSPSENLFNHIGYGNGGMSTGSRGDIVYRNIQNGKLEQPYGQPAVPPPGYEFAPPPPGRQLRGQSPFYRTGSVWGSYTYSSFSMGDDKNSFKYAYHRNGAMFGNEWNLTPSSVLGGFAMVNDGSLGSLGDKVKSFDYDFGVYFVAAPFEQFEVKSYTGIGFQSYKMDRYIRNNDIYLGGNSLGLFGINEHYDSETNGTSFNYAVEFARPFTVSPNFVIRPAAGFEYQNVRQKGFTERASIGSTAAWSNSGTNIAEDALIQGVTQGPTSGNYAMQFKTMDFNRSLLRLGFNTESYFARGGLQFRAYHVGRLTGDRYPVSRQSFTSGSQLFNVRGAELGNSYAQLGFGSHLWLNQERSATMFMSSDWNFSLVNSGYNMLNLNVGFQVGF